MSMATDRPADLDELLGEASAAKPPKRARPRLPWSWKRVAALRVEDIPERWFWWLNTALAVLIVVVALRVAFLLIWPMTPVTGAVVERPAALDTSSPAGTVPARSPATVQIPSLAAASTRSMFQAETLQPAQQTAAPLSEPAKSVLSKLNVLGIVTGNPTQAIIEDTTTHKTYMVSVGQVLVDGIQVEAIEPWRVMVTWQGERIELRL